MTTLPPTVFGGLWLFLLNKTEILQVKKKIEKTETLFQRLAQNVEIRSLHWILLQLVLLKMVIASGKQRILRIVQTPAFTLCSRGHHLHDTLHYADRNKCRSH